MQSQLFDFAIIRIKISHGNTDEDSKTRKEVNKD